VDVHICVYAHKEPGCMCTCARVHVCIYICMLANERAQVVVVFRVQLLSCLN